MGISHIIAFIRALFRLFVAGLFLVVLMLGRLAEGLPGDGYAPYPDTGGQSSGGRPAAAEYHAGDAALVAALIDEYGIDGYDSGAPSAWEGLVVWSDTVPKRVSYLHLSAQDISGVLRISGLTALEVLNCGDNSLTGLELADLPALRHLDCAGNTLAHLDLTGLGGLRYLSCSDNALTGLDLRHCPKLEQLSCSGNSLTALELDAVPLLEYLSCSENRLTALDLSGLPRLRNLYAGSNALATLKLAHGGALEHMTCDDNRLTSLDLTGQPNMKKVYCYENELQQLEVRGLVRLSFIGCSGNRLAALDLAGLDALDELYASRNALTGLELAPVAKSLRVLHCASNKLTRLDLDGLSRVYRLDVGGNYLDSLNLHDMAALKDLDCSSNELTGLELAGAPLLEKLDCSLNALEALGVRGFENLTRLDVSYNMLTALDTTGAAGKLKVYGTANPVATLTMPAGRTLSFGASGGGRAIFSVVDFNRGTLTALGEPDAGAGFSHWEVSGPGEPVYDNPLTLEFDSGVDLALHANFNNTPRRLQYLVVLGDYKKPDKAESRAAEIRADGFNASAISDRDRYRVELGVFTELNGAVAHLKEMRRAGYDAAMRYVLFEGDTRVMFAL